MAESGSRRTLVTAQVLLVAAAAALWIASRLPWVSIRSFDELSPPTTTTLSGAEWSTVLLPAALVLLAAVVAALAVRGWPLRVLALLVAALSLAMGYLAIGQWAASDVAARAAHLAQIPVQSLTAGTERHLLGAGITMAAAACALVAAVLLLRAATGRDGAAKYTTPAARRESARDDDTESGPMSERLIWDALDEGRDPTDTEGR